MIFRAVFVIGLIYVLTPHEPDLGLGRPGAWLPSSSDSILSGLPHLEPSGKGPPALTDSPRGLADIKAEISAAIRARDGAHS